MLFDQLRKNSSARISYGLPFNLARFFSLVSLVIVSVSSVLLAFFIGQNTTSTLLESQKDYAYLLSENFNRQFFRTFILPRLLMQKQGLIVDSARQYMIFDQLVTTAVHGMHMETVRIYDENFKVTYSIDSNDVDRTDLYSHAVPQAFTDREYYFDVLSSFPYVFALFAPELAEDSYLLRTTCPLTVDISFASAVENDIGMDLFYGDEILGVLEITQDITSHYRLAIRSQRLIIAGFFASCLILFVLIQIMARQAERILAERVQRNLELEANLFQSERLASMGRMVASIAHEIRNPLGIIRSSSELLLKRLKGDDASLKPMLEAIYDESCRLGVTVNDFLDYARPKQPNYAPADVNAVLDKALVFLADQFARRAVVIEKNIPADLEISGDADLLYRAFYNILVNADQAMEHGGSICIEGRMLPDNKEMELIFRDTGPGFSSDTLDKPLDPFYTTKDSGTGLGLPIVQSIITGHGGSIEVSNAAQGGAVIRIVLPGAAG